MDTVGDRRDAPGAAHVDTPGWPGRHALVYVDALQLVPAGRRAVVVLATSFEVTETVGALLLQLAGASRAVEAWAACTGGHGPHTAGDLDLPAGAISGVEELATTRILSRLYPGDIVLAPWRHGGVPDQQALGQAAARACGQAHATLIELPLGIWQTASPEDRRFPWYRARRVAADAATLRQNTAALQSYPLSDAAPDGAGAKPLRPYELVLV